MPTEKPRISFALPEDLRSKIDAFQYEFHMKNLSQAVIHLLERGLDEMQAVTKESDDKENEPVPMDELARVAPEFIAPLSALNPQNRRLLLGIAALLLQEQQRNPGSGG